MASASIYLVEVLDPATGQWAVPPVALAVGQELRVRAWVLNELMENQWVIIGYLVTLPDQTGKSWTPPSRLARAREIVEFQSFSVATAQAGDYTLEMSLWDQESERFLRDWTGKVATASTPPPAWVGLLSSIMPLVVLAMIVPVLRGLPRMLKRE